MYNWDMTELQKLPIDSSKTETIKILKAENKAVKMLAELKGCANLIPNQSILINAVVLQESKDSSEIENIITTKDNLYKAVSETVKKIDSATKEVMFYREALYTGFYQLKEHDFISINDIVQIQKVLVQNDAGIRTLPGTKLVNDTTNEVVYTPPQTKEEIDELLKNFTEYLNNEDDSLSKLAILHYQFESIHPFYDGNGRTGRLILNLELIRNGFPPINVKFTDRKRYYDAFDAYYKEDDAMPMIELIAEYIGERLDQYLEVLRQYVAKTKEGKQWKEEIKAKRLKSVLF